MANGATSVAGFVYQQDYAAFVFLGSEAQRTLRDNHQDCVASIHIESPGEQNGSVWDVWWTLENDEVHVRECKDTAITSEDRRKFYRRVRVEIASGVDPAIVHIGWATDEAKQRGPILDHLRAMRELASTETGPPCEEPDRVNSAESAFAEAMYHLVLAPDIESGAPPLQTDDARQLLSRLKIDVYARDDLADSVENLAPSVFENGTGASIRKVIQGEVTTRIADVGHADYNRNTLLETVGAELLRLSLRDRLREILRFNSAVGRRSPNSGIVWAQLRNTPAKTWQLEERIPGFDQFRNNVVIAPTGAGKTFTARQVLEEQARQKDPYHVLLIDASGFVPENVEALPQLCFLLCGVAPTWLAIDGLDLIRRDEHALWKQTLDRLIRIPRLTLFLTAREEVFSVHEWMQDLLAPLQSVALPPLNREQITDAFREVQLRPPDGDELMNCLENPFLFSTYARIVTPDDLPLATSGPVSAFNVIEEFWRRRVVSESAGGRAVGQENSTVVAKCAAAAYLIRRTHAGEETIYVDSVEARVADGIEMLRNEGVVVRHGTAAVKWAHAWLREYALVDGLLSSIDRPSANALAEAVSSIEIDHVARTAAIGACKWIVAHAAWGPVEGFLTTLYRRNPGWAREALSVLVEGSSRHLNLGVLPEKLVIEALSIARQVGASQWKNQIETLPDTMFEGPDGAELQWIVAKYETEVES